MGLFKSLTWLKDGRSSRMDTVVARVTHPTSVSDNLATPRHRCRICSGDNVSARRHRLRSGIGRAGHMRALRYDRAASSVCAVRPEPDFSAGTRLIAGCCHSGRSLSLSGGEPVPLSGGEPVRAVALAGMMALVSGIVCILAGVARLGFVTELLSKPIRYGYMN